jgi:hypothetical protein
MIATPYDIFRRDLLGTPVWMEAVQDIETAKLRMMEMAGRSPGEYFVFSQETQEIVCETPPRLFELAFQYRSLQSNDLTGTCVLRTSHGASSFPPKQILSN